MGKPKAKDYGVDGGINITGHLFFGRLTTEITDAERAAALEALIYREVLMVRTKAFHAAVDEYRHNNGGR